METEQITQEQDERQEKKRSKRPRKERAPMPEAEKRLLRRIFIPIICVVLAVGVFFAGFGVHALTVDKELLMLLKIKNKIQSEYYQEITDKQFYDTLLTAINEDLLDPYSEYMTADEYAATRYSAEGNQSGLGLVFKTSDQKMLVSRVAGNSPAEEAGLLAGDYLQAFGKTDEELVYSTLFDDFSAFLQGFKAGEAFVVQVDRGGETKTFTLAKKTYVEGYVFYRTANSSYRFTGAKALSFTVGGAPLAALPEDTAYIRLTHFNGEADIQFDTAMDKFKADKKKHLILDLRGNGGGYMSILQSIAQYFCKSSDKLFPVVSIADYGERTESFKAKGNKYKEYFKTDSRVCVLADDSSASASEVLLGCMLDYGATAYADVCLFERDGVAKTYGKGIMQTTFPFGIGKVDAIKLTTATLRWPVSGTCIHGRGILPQDGVQVGGENILDDKEIEEAIQIFFN
ncbi:MAG: PDZ domain-containing protein [Clostridia bacterium]|nr:PDZ domain-containing protein [Clostridia bacterium]